MRSTQAEPIQFAGLNAAQHSQREIYSTRGAKGITTTYAYSVWALLASAGDVPQTAMAQCRLALDPVNEQYLAAINQPAGDTLLHRRNAGGQSSACPADRSRTLSRHRVSTAHSRLLFHLYSRKRRVDGYQCLARGPCAALPSPGHVLSQDAHAGRVDRAYR